jgi:AraC-like DNA-binding protein
MSILDRINDWPKQAYKAGYDGGRLASNCKISLGQLRRFVAHSFGKTLEGWLIELRLCMAAKRLATANAQIKVVREEVGFKSDSHFCTRFKTLFGSTPSAFAVIYREKRQKLKRDLKSEYGPVFRTHLHMPPELWEELEFLICQKILSARHFQQVRPVESKLP